MHGPIRDKLEDLVRPDSGQEGLLGEHLASCVECSSELSAMRSQAVQLGMLRNTTNLEPAPGFYARVLQRIEECEVDSFWSFFLDSTVSKRLAVASLTLFLALGGYAVSQATQDRPPASHNIVALNNGFHRDVLVMGTVSEQRDAVLENFAEHHLADSEGQ
jgi:hypothetical protein